MTIKTQQELDNSFLIHFVKTRVASFKDWPFQEDCACTPKKMAEAGFYHCPTEQEPDLVKCYVCLKELDGWEPTDDPWEEHKSHSGQCDFLKLKDKKLTVRDLIQLEGKRKCNAVKKAQERVIEDYKQHCQEARKEMEALAD